MALPPLSSKQPVELRRVPRSLPSQQHTIPKTGSQYPDGQDDDSSDTDSISSVYTAPEGADPEIPTTADHREGVEVL